MFNKSNKSKKESVEKNISEGLESDKAESALQNAGEEKINNDNAGYEFEFKFVDGMNEIEKKQFNGEGDNESEAIIDARKKADAYSNGKYIVVFTGNFKKL